MRSGLAMRDAIHEYGAQPHYQAWLAEALSRVGRAPEGLERLASYLDKKHEVLVYEPEIHLARASLYLAENQANTADAMRSILAAIEIARGHGSKSFELRATTALARLLAGQGRRHEPHTMLAVISHWFAEGFDTADLKDARALLGELGSNV